MANMFKHISRAGNLPAPEVIKLMQVANTFVENDTCEIDTASIKSKSEANAPCATDEIDFCEQSVLADFSCEKDYCPTCAQAHTCDHFCGIPCPTDDTGVAVVPQPQLQLCTIDTITFCEQATTSGLYSCTDDFCISCSQAHSCDMTCQLPCAADAGHRRQLQSISDVLASQADGGASLFVPTQVPNLTSQPSAVSHPNYYLHSYFVLQRQRTGPAAPLPLAPSP